MAKANRSADFSPTTLRLSMDTKATIAIGEYSRNGRLRCREIVKALDHDMEAKTKLIPAGILNMQTNQLRIIFGASHKTSDFIVDCLEIWWQENRHEYLHIKELLINSDNGSETNGRRTQFLYRMVRFADSTGLRIHLVYYPPYHSKYNSIERCWGILESHWNGTLLDSIDKAISWANTMTWRSVYPVVSLLEQTYHKGISLSKTERVILESRLSRSPNLPYWDIVIEPSIRV